MPRTVCTQDAWLVPWTSCDQDSLYPEHLAGALDKRFILSTPGLYPGQLFHPQDNWFVPSSCTLYTMFFGEPRSCGYGSGIQLIPVMSLPQGGMMGCCSTA